MMIIYQISSSYTRKKHHKTVRAPKLPTLNLIYGTEDSDQSGYGHTDNTPHQSDQFSFGSGET